MFHSNTQRMIDYWRSRAEFGGAPDRASLDPAHFARLAPQAFILGRSVAGVYPIRLAGELVCDLHGRPLRGQNFLALVAAEDRFNLQTALEIARRRPEPLVATMEALTDETSLPLELLIAPLATRMGQPDRFLGLYQPLSMVSRLDGGLIRQLTVRSVRGVGPANEETPRLRLATLSGRRVA